MTKLVRLALSQCHSGQVHLRLQNTAASLDFAAFRVICEPDLWHGIRETERGDSATGIPKIDMVSFLPLTSVVGQNLANVLCMASPRDTARSDQLSATPAAACVSTLFVSSQFSDNDDHAHGIRAQGLVISSDFGGGLGVIRVAESWRPAMSVSGRTRWR